MKAAKIGLDQSARFQLSYPADIRSAQVVSTADDRTLFGLLTLDAAIAVFDLSQHQAVSALALPGDRPLSPPLLSILEQGMHSHVMPLAQCQAQAQAAIASLRCWMPAFLQSCISEACVRAGTDCRSAWIGCKLHYIVTRGDGHHGNAIRCSYSERRCLQAGCVVLAFRDSLRRAGAQEEGTAAVISVSALTCLTCMRRSSDRAHEQHHGSTAVALSLAVHMARCAVAGRAASPSQDCRAPSIPQMHQSNGRTSPIHIILLSADGTPQVHACQDRKLRIQSCIKLSICICGVQCYTWAQASPAASTEYA